MLGELSDEKAEELFNLMEDDEKADVAELMHFDHDTAGGLMTTEFLVFPKDLTVGETIAERWTRFTNRPPRKRNFSHTAFRPGTSPIAQMKTSSGCGS